MLIPFDSGVLRILLLAQVAPKQFAGERWPDGDSAASGPGPRNFPAILGRPCLPSLVAGDTVGGFV